jgi:hypothetical protein
MSGAGSPSRQPCRLDLERGSRGLIHEPLSLRLSDLVIREEEQKGGTTKGFIVLFGLTTTDAPGIRKKSCEAVTRTQRERK